jgi:excisionase family DNA binding protein
MSNITFETLPAAVADLREEIAELKTQVKAALAAKQAQPETEPFLTIKEAAAFMQLSVATLYDKVHNQTIPYCKQGKRLYFLKSELAQCIKAGRNATLAQTDAIASTYVAGKKRGEVRNG